MTFREAQREAWRRIGMSEIAIKDAFAFADINSPSAAINNPLKLKDGMTEDQFINQLVELQKKINTDDTCFAEIVALVAQEHRKKLPNN